MSRALAPQALELVPRAAQLDVGQGLEPRPRHHPRAQEIGDLLGVGHIALVAVELPGFAHAERRQRIDQHVRLVVLGEEVRDRLPEMAGGLEGVHGTSALAPEPGRRRPLQELGKAGLGNAASETGSAAGR